MALETYRKKRQFGATPEPRGRRSRAGGNRFVVHKHAARRLHYDLRLELDGVMKSWAVTRGPSFDPADKRLSVHVEDHPIEYNSFEGTIPQGQYGGGTVMIWDRGRWIPDGDPNKGYAKGHLTFALEGRKLRGRWHLVRMRGRPNERHENWLLIKGKDEAAQTGVDAESLPGGALSVASGRTMEEIAAGKGKARVWQSNRGAAGNERRIAEGAPADAGTARQQAPARAAAKTRSAAARRQGRRAGLPDFVPPSLAIQRAAPPGGPGWLHEIKLDGYRLEARLERGDVQLLTRNRQDWTHRFAPIAEAVATLPARSALLDGELVVEDDKGISRFSLLQTALKERRTERLVYWVFDLLYLDGRDLTGEPLLVRKAALERLLAGTGAGAVRYVEHFDEDGRVIWPHVGAMGLEGVVSKRRDAPYQSGRSDNFVKAKCHDDDDFVVVGFAPAAGMADAVGALAVASREGGKLRYVGRVGTGYTRATARKLWQLLDGLRVGRPPLALPQSERRKDLVWVKPVIIVRVEHRGTTPDNLLRQAAYKGLSEDKSELAPAAAPPAAGAEATAATAHRSAPPGTAMTAVKSKPPQSSDKSAQVANVNLTHAGRVYWPDVGVTKADLADYYARVWNWIAPHLVGRPLALLRCPEGVDGARFFQKHIPASIKSAPLRHRVDAKEHDVIAVERLDDLIAAVQSGALEIHVRGSRLDALEACDRIVFDFDPGEGVGWDAIVAAARETRERLKRHKLESFVKLSGSKGVHVMVPIEDAEWDAAKTFAQEVALAMAADSPDRYVATSVKRLRAGRIYVDYLRNSRDATSVAAYSTRARAGAPVSAPVSWQQLGRTTAADQFTVLDLKKHLRDDPWRDAGKVRQRLPKK